MAVNQNPELILAAAHRCAVMGEELAETIVMYAVGRGIDEATAVAYAARLMPPPANVLHGMCMAASHHMLTLIESKQDPDPALKSN